MKPKFWEVMMKNTEKVALITGGSRGIGKAICLALAAHDINIIVNYVRNEKAAAEVVQQCREFNVDAIALQANIGIAEDVRVMFEKTLERFGRLDILVNNAGVETVAPFEKLTENEWDKVFNTNLKGILLCSQQAIPVMKNLGKGFIINITSLVAQQVWTGYSHYCASKAGADMLTKCMAVELAPFGITVNGIAPGNIDTDMTRADLSKTGEIEAAIYRTPTKRLGTPEDVARIVLFLVDPAGDFLTGEIITVDGGYRLSGDPIFS
jgi:NAD(P)-dependent dehydrogenase (short-subunit alcohol dehydrogenase family)